jgi:hypothetical protein
VHLRTTPRGLELYDATALRLRPDEHAELRAALAPVWHAAGLTAHWDAPAQGWLELAEDPGPVALAPGALIGQDVDAALPAGAAGRRWRRLLNDMQMALHDHPVNRRRAARGELAVNSLWLWGGGAWPTRPALPWASIASDCDWVRGLGVAAGVPCGPLPADATAWLASAGAGVHLVVIERACAWPLRYRDHAGWCTALQALESAWIAPLFAAVRRGRLRRLVLADAGRQWCYTRAAGWRLWRRATPWSLRAAEAEA